MSATILQFPKRFGRARVAGCECTDRFTCRPCLQASINPHRSGMAPASAWDRLLGAAGVPETEVTTTEEEM